MCCGNSILQKGLPFFYLHKIFYTLYEDHIIDLINNLKEIIFLEEDSMSFTSSRSESIFFREFKKIVDAVID